MVYVFKMSTPIFRAETEWNQEGQDVSMKLKTQIHRECDILQNEEHLLLMCVKNYQTVTKTYPYFLLK